MLLEVSRYPLTEAEQQCVANIEAHKVKFEISPKDAPEAPQDNLICFLKRVADVLASNGKSELAIAIGEVVQQSVLHPDFGGYGLSKSAALDAQQDADIIFLVSAYLEAVESAARMRKGPRLLRERPCGRRAMTMTEKIFAMHDVARRGWVKPGDIIQVDVDWILASEISWKGMEKVYEGIGRPGIFRNDRFWLAGDHRAEPELYNVPAVRKLMDASEKAKSDFKMTEFQGFNYTILHTEFVRERAQPGMLVIGADSHSCSAGAVSCLSIGMGSTDVCMPLVTGQQWFAVPETVNLRLVNKPPRGVGGKDTILYILKEFKRNTIAADRVVEFTGPGVESLSCDSRFAIANMCTEFGAVSGIFQSDQKTLDFIDRRRQKKYKSSAVYFRPDENAKYSRTFEVDLSKVQSFIALYPSPDNVVPVNDKAGTHLNGCFIGACTTAEEELIIGAMVLQAGLEKGWSPVKKGRRVVVPGSNPIRAKMERLGLIDIYRRAGFKVGVPGCSMCIGQGVDQAAPGEIWLSSQNRNFKNRMGPGSIANLASAATVAASSLKMEITDPRELLDVIDLGRLEKYLGYLPFENESFNSQETIQYSEPYGADQAQTSDEPGSADTVPEPQMGAVSGQKIKGRVIRLGDFIDTDAIAPSKFLMTSTTDEELGSHCMEFFMPEFRQQVKDGQNIVVGGQGFGVGSSRDVAVNALLGAGVRCVIAKSFGFIYARNQPNIGLLGITISEEAFYETAQVGVDIEVDVDASLVICGGKKFGFSLSDMEKQLIAVGGLTEAFKKYGRQLFDVMCRTREVRSPNPVIDIENVSA